MMNPHAVSNQALPMVFAPRLRMIWMAMLFLSITIASIVVLLQWGSVDIPVVDMWHCLTGQCTNRLQDTIIWQIRLPRILLGCLVGAGLACSGVVMQTAIRNPLADPYLFGVVAGAGLGIVTASSLLPLLSASWFPLAAFFGASSAIVLIVALAYFVRRVEAIVLCGVAVSFMLGAATQMMLYLGEPLASNRIMFWLMGSLAGAEMSQVITLALVFIVSLAVALLQHRQLNVLLLDDDTARSLGVNAVRLRVLSLLGCAFVTAVIVAYAGGIGFVGLMVPHMVRLFTGNQILPLLLGSTLAGGVLLMWVDLIAREVLPGQDIPIGIITSAFGSLFFILLLLRAQRATAMST